MKIKDLEVGKLYQVLAPNSRYSSSSKAVIVLSKELSQGPYNWRTNNGKGIPVAVRRGGGANMQWVPKRVPASHIRMLWSDYLIQQAEQEKVQKAYDEQRAIETAAKLAFAQDITDSLDKLGIGYKTGGYPNYDDSVITLTNESLAALVILAKNGADQ